MIGAPQRIIEDFRDHFDVSRETIEKLTQYQVLVEKWTPKINLISRSTVDNIWERHFWDSAQIFKLIPENASKLVDLGSGGGLPGIVLSILAAELRSDLKVVLVESDMRKWAFLQTTVQTLDINAKAICGRIEEVGPLDADIVTARALAPLSGLLPLVNLHLSDAGTAILPKGENFQAELDAVQADWSFSLQKEGSQTDQRAVLLVFQNLRSISKT